jgi:hypothetical protein
MKTYFSPERIAKSDYMLWRYRDTVTRSVVGTIIFNINIGFEAWCHVNNGFEVFKTFAAAAHYMTTNLTALGYKHLPDHYKVLI